MSQSRGRDQDGSRYAARPFLLTLALALSLLLTGCATTTLFTGHEFDVALRYTGQGPLSDCKVTSAKGVSFEAGYMLAGLDKSLAGPFRHPAADVWTVRWKPAGGEEIAQKLDLTQVLPKPFAGRLTFIIDAHHHLSHTISELRGQ